MAHFCNPEKEGQQEVEREPSGFGAPKRVNVSSNGVLYSRWQPNPKRMVQSCPWFRVECCTRWPAHNVSYINGVCGHRNYEGCILTIQQPYSMEACPVCCFHTTHFTAYLYHVNASGLILFRPCFLAGCHSFVMMVTSIPFFNRLSFGYRDGNATPRSTREGAFGMSPCKEQICKGHATQI